MEEYYILKIYSGISLFLFVRPHLKKTSETAPQQIVNFTTDNSKANRIKYNDILKNSKLENEINSAKKEVLDCIEKITTYKCLIVHNSQVGKWTCNGRSRPLVLLDSLIRR